MIKSLWNKTLFLSVIIECLALVASSAIADQTQTFSGNFPIDSYVDIPFTIDAHSEVKFEYDSLCDNSDNLKFFLRVAQRVNDFEPGYAIASGTGTTSPVDNIPLNKGGYIARLICGHVIKSPPDPEWTMTIISSPISISFAQDQEPAPEDPINLNSTMSFTGWLGLWGTPGLIHPTAPSSQGRDVWDYHFFNMKKDTKLKFKIEWDFKTGIDDPDIDFGVLFYKYIDGKIQFVHFFPALESSGDMTEEITLVEDAVYQVGFGGSAVGFNDDKKRYGGYKATVILNGVIAPPPPPPPPPGLFHTFQEATWVKQPGTRFNDDSYNLVIKYNIKNTYNETKTIDRWASVHVPILKTIPGDFNAGLTSEIIDAINSSCETDTTDWSDFCHRQGDYCAYEVYGGIFPRSSISALGNVEYVVSIPVTLAGYSNFDDSLQIIRLTTSAVGGPTQCFTHGIYFWPAWAIALPGVRFLLLNNQGN